MKRLVLLAVGIALVVTWSGTPADACDRCRWAITCFDTWECIVQEWCAPPPVGGLSFENCTTDQYGCRTSGDICRWV